MPKRLSMIALGLILLAAGALGGWLWQSRMADPAASLASADRAAIEQVVREYILSHPEILPEAMENLRRRETAKQLSGVKGDVEKPFPGAILGNPDGKVTLVEFTDFACTYCKQSVEDVDALIAANKDLRVVVRELPILSPESEEAARWGLAAAEQGKYGQFHRAMFAAGRPSRETIEAVAASIGMDLDRARRFAADPRVDAELARNLELARQLGFNGTPSWVVGEEMLSGAVGKDELARAIAAASGG
ncbi:MAG: hypothetical protein RIQ46_1954 [Pseudomonadota bacterium]